MGGSNIKGRSNAIQQPMHWKEQMSDSWPVHKCLSSLSQSKLFGNLPYLGFYKKNEAKMYKNHTTVFNQA